MYKLVKCALGLCVATLGWSQTVTFPAVPISAPGTAAPAPVLLTGLLTGMTSETVATVSQRCSIPMTTTGPETLTPSNDLQCVTTGGNPRLLMRQGSYVTRSGDSLLPAERQMTLNNGQTGVLVEGIDLLQENGGAGATPTIAPLTRVDSPTLTCETGPSGQSVLTRRGISGYAYNDPLNVLYVETVHSVTTYQASGNSGTGSTGMPATSNCGSGATMDTPVSQEITRTLIRVSGFNAARPQY